MMLFNFSVGSFSFKAAPLYFPSMQRQYTELTFRTLDITNKNGGAGQLRFGVALLHEVHHLWSARIGIRNR